MKQLIVCLLVSFLINLVHAQAPQSAEAIMTEAYGVAKIQNKKVFVMFHASWCGWCHKMDAAMNEPEMKKYFDDNFVIRHLVVLESESKKNLENPGAAEMMKKYYGDKSGILAIGLAGVLGIILRSYFLNLTARRLERLKYSIAEGFRQN